GPDVPGPRLGPGRRLRPLRSRPLRGPRVVCGALPVERDAVRDHDDRRVVPGNAWIAWRVARDPSLSRAFGLLAYLWLFGISEAAVVIWFRDLIATRSCAGGGISRLIPTVGVTPQTDCLAPVLTWPYPLWIGLTVVFAIVGS